MGPKPKSQQKDKQSSSFKAIDDFLEKSSSPADVQLTQQHLETQLKQIKEKYFEQFSATTLQKNVQHLNNLRTLTLVFGGMAAGIYGFDGLQGMLFYLAMILFVSVVIGARMGFKGQPYFTDLSQACTTGMFSNILTYLLMWVMFHNLVYVL
ncbi:transmembrane protein 93 [Stylonychia lemnae]|uniref:ER membrane protein complex subunit 6 n=1 Tax=Stylonychia lemnae TaxID=5949 RepID=A0A078AD61_STYLE|nr:transmembrane protein 93 [Stylonychia lemnae]|eukprot:CDW80179.1 transmembrane protein 93 [Stylonychia lemnae]